jgi:hypothetical protein
METRRTIELELPEGSEASPEELNALRTTLEAVVGLRYEGGGAWREIERRLRAAGWTVECGLQWHVVARCGREVEEACGRTRNEAYARLDQVARSPVLEGRP